MPTKRYNNNKTRKQKKYNKRSNKKKNQRGRGNMHSHKLKSRSIKLNKVNCSPKDKKEIKNYTCYTDKSLFKLREKWNLRHPDVKILTNDPKEIHKLLANSKYLFL